MEKSHKMQGKQASQGEFYLDRLAALAEGGSGSPMAVEAARCKAMMSAGDVIPEECGPDIRPSLTSGSFVLVQNIELLPVGNDKVEAVHRGYGGRKAIRRADVFDAMVAAAARRKQPCPLTFGQISVGRRYHDLVELLSADGTKLSSLRGGAGGPDGRDWMDRRIELSAEIDQLRRRIGTGVAMAVRRVRPSDRGGPAARQISDMALVDAVCLKDKCFKAILMFHGWSTYSGNQKALSAALSGALDRMIGYRGKKSS